MLGDGGTKRAMTPPDLQLPKEADHEHYLNVFASPGFKRWRSASPSSATSVGESSSDSDSLLRPLGPPLFSGEDGGAETLSVGSVATDESAVELSFPAAKIKSSLENLDKACGSGRHKRLRQGGVGGRARAADIEEDCTTRGEVGGLVVLHLDSSKAAALSRSCRWGGPFRKIPEGGEVTLSELREMATRQQHQIETQQQLLVAREQRLKYLKQQEGRSAQVSLEAERLRRLRERVEAQEAKLRRLRALRGQVDSSLLNAASLSSDLEAMRRLFSEKEKELVDAAAKVEELTKQLEEVRAGRATLPPGQSGGGAGPLANAHNSHLQIHHQEVDKLRRELLYRNSVNREASSRVASQREALTTRKDEIARIDKRIAELQQRLYRKRFLNQQLASQISAATQAKQAQLKAVQQQKSRRDGSKENSVDDIVTEERRTLEDLVQFERGNQDPKYQTLPYNTKFSSGSKLPSEGGGIHGSTPPPQQQQQQQPGSVGSVPPAPGVLAVARTVHSIPTHLPSKGHASAPNCSPTGSSGSGGIISSHQVLSALVGRGQNHLGGRCNGSFSQMQSSVGSQQEPQQLLYGTKINSSEETIGSNKPHQRNLQQSQKINQGSNNSNTFPQQNRSSTLPQTSLVHHPHNKDVENVRAFGFPPGNSSSSSGSPKKPSSNGGPSNENENLEHSSPGGKVKPILPPKPIPHSKPTPPPRQKGDPMAGSTESLNMAGVTRQSSNQNRSQVFRYASQNVILSTYTQQQEQKSQSDQKQMDLPVQEEQQHQASQDQTLREPSSNASSVPIPSEPEGKEPTLSEDNETKSEKVHISINRRIEMPPDFLFPEDATPPSDLLGRQQQQQQQQQQEQQQRRRRLQFDQNSKSENLEDFDTPDRIGGSINEVGNQAKNNNNNNNLKSSNNNILSINNNNNNNENAILNTKNLNSTMKDIEMLKIAPGDKDGTGPEPAQDSLNHEYYHEQTSHDDKESEKGEEISKGGTSTSPSASLVVRRLKKGNLKDPNSSRVPRRVSFDPLALLLDASLEGELELVKRTATEVTNPSAANDEGITALHNAICAGHLDIVTFLVTFGCDVNAQDSDGWTPLHCAASCNNVAMVRFLVEHGACVLATTLSDHETAAEKCEQDEEGYDGCSQYLYSVQEKLGIMNGGVVYGVYDYDAQNDDELTMKCGDSLTVLRRGDEYEREWWWASKGEKTGYVPRNLLGLYPRVKDVFKESS